MISVGRGFGLSTCKGMGFVEASCTALPTGDPGNVKKEKLATGRLIRTRANKIIKKVLSFMEF